MKTSDPVTIHRLDYQPSNWTIDHTRLSFELDPAATLVSSNLSLRRNPATSGGLTLQGVDCRLLSISVDGHALGEADYQLTETELYIANLPDECQVGIVTEINPDANKALEGLYRSSGNFCTQCEAEGFRKITFYLDRPDVLSTFDVHITADVGDYPVLLANGNRISEEQLPGGKHRVHWHDPHPKPSYLFALVAGKLSFIEDHFVTASGRDVLLQIYVEAHNLDQCDYAMQSLKASMRWDEKVYGLEYDLDCFMIVAVDDFNMGAMENKGLNIFNSRFVLADAQTATDNDYLGVEAVIAHEYFHNWTGNRITCRDWFQLSLKEGLTVFRDQCFSADQHSATVKRIEDVRLLRSRQFAEDASPMAHPIRPESFIEINNFYTLTVYEKGAEVIRMLHTLLGPVNWRKGIDVYVERHDGTATTCDAFIDAMQSVCEIDLAQFRRWYSTAGTPELFVSEQHDATTGVHQLTVRQQCPDTPGQPDKAPLHIPLRMALLDAQGRELALSVGRPVDDQVHTGVVLDITEREHCFSFEGIEHPPVASLLRGFSAPVKLHHEVSDDSLAFLMAHDTDTFNRWESGQRLAQRVVLGALETDLRPATSGSDSSTLNTASFAALSKAFAAVLSDKAVDMSFKAEALTLPTIESLAEMLDSVDYQALCRVHDQLACGLAEQHADALIALVEQVRPAGLELLDPLAMSARKLGNTALSLLSRLPEQRWIILAQQQYELASNMTDRLAALTVLCSTSGEARDRCLEDFLVRADENRLVIDKWFAVQAMARRDSIVEDVIALTEHELFEPTNPNRLRSVVASFALNNPAGFHALDGRGYRFLADQVLALDKFNPQVAARMVAPLGRWERLRSPGQSKMKAQLLRIHDSGPLSPDVYELVSKSLSA